MNEDDGAHTRSAKKLRIAAAGDLHCCDPRRDEITRSLRGLEQSADLVLLCGDLTVNGVTRQVEFDLEFEGVSPDPWGGTRAAFTATTEINRKDFGLEWNVALETGGVLVGDKVKLELDIQAVKA